MDETDVDICQASNNDKNDVLKEENEDFTGDLESGSGTNINQQTEADADFDSEVLTRPISAVSENSSVLEDGCFKSTLSERVREDTNTQNYEKSSRVLRLSAASGLHYSNDVKKSASPSLDEIKFDATVPDDSLEDDQSVHKILETSKNDLEPDQPRVAVSPDFSKFSSPTTGSDLETRFEADIAAEIRELDISQNPSALDRGSGISDDELRNILSELLPEVPSNDPVSDFVDRSSIDGGSRSGSHASSHAVSRSYIFSSVSVGEDIPNLLQDDNYRLIPRFKADGRGFCWPIDKLPLSGEQKFEEGEHAQWKIHDSESRPIGYGASGQCFIGHPIGKENDIFCVKKCEYNEEEVKALCLAAKEMCASKKISEGAKKIVSFFGATYYKPNVCIFMEYMEGGTVFDAIKEALKQYKDGLDKIDCVNYSKDVLLALKYIHGKGIVHNDIKANNVLLTASKLEAKLCDFGKAAAITQHNLASRDVWAAGCFLLEMLGKKYSSALRSGIMLRTNDVLSRLPDDRDQDTYQVLSKCFCEDRSKCTAVFVLTSEVFNKN